MSVYEQLMNLEPRSFFHWFYEISQIPHISRHEQALAARICAEAEKRAIPVEKDAMGNLLLRLPATAGLEDRPALLIQAHLDMVAAAAPGVEFDFLTQPLELVIRDRFLYANGTTLGADNAVGLATMMALAFSEEIPHPELELLFTVQEELGLYGIRAFDCSKLRARRMINTDSGDAHTLCISSAGSSKCHAQKRFAMTDASALSAVRLEIGGGLGGHSGIMIGAGRVCAANFMGWILEQLSEAFDVRLKETCSKGSAILTQTSAVLCVDPAQRTALLERCQALADTYLAAYRSRDPGVTLTCTPIEPVCTALSHADTLTVARSLTQLPSTALFRDEDDPEVVITSLCIMGFSLTDGAYRLRFTVRSESDAQRHTCCAQMQQRIEALGLDFTLDDSYDGWPMHRESPLRDTLRRLHEQIHGSAPGTERIHGGVEAGVILGALPDMDAVGYCPTSHGAHTPGEHLYLDEVLPFWQVLTALLQM